MKLADVAGLFRKKPKIKDYYLSVYLDVADIAACVWVFGAGGQMQILATSTEHLTDDSWNSRLEAADRALAVLEERVGTDNLTNVIFGLPQVFLTETGDIKKDIRAEIKKLAKALELTPVGFVPIHQALIYTLKKNEGVPPSMVLLGVSGPSIAVSVYKVGSLVGSRLIDKRNHIATSVEEALQTFENLEVLPARIVIFGSDNLEGVKSELLKYPWTTRVNFLHFPKIEIQDISHILIATSVAGASEMAATVRASENTDVSSGGLIEESATEDQKVPPVEEGKSLEEAIIEENVDRGLESRMKTVAEDAVAEKVQEARDILTEDLAPQESHEDANVQEVTPEELGFKKNVDILETPARPKKSEEAEHSEEKPHAGFSFALLQISFTRLVSLFPRKGLLPAAVGILVLCGLFGGFMYWILPHATVTVYELPKFLNQVTQITISPSATAVEAERNIIPAKRQERSVSGEKTIPVTGKKNVGDPARGTVTIYNKSLTSKTFKKGTILTANSLQFTLDSDVTIASASETIGSITFEKEDVGITASAIGPEGNVPAGTEFTIRDVSPSVAVARNEKALTGGTSRHVTVVTRADYNTLVDELSEELVDKAKQELAGMIGGAEKLIDATIETVVNEKVFNQELDQESNQLQGKLTITVSGITYSEQDIKTMAKALAVANIPDGYMLSEEKTTVNVSDIKVLKNGNITANASVTTIALPVVDTYSIQKALAGKTIRAAQEYLRSLPGIASVEFGFRFSPTARRLPFNKNNISVTIAVQE